MAKTLGTITIDVLAKVGRLEAEMAKARKSVEKNTNTIRQTAERNMRMVTNAFKAVAVGALTREVVRLSDAWTNQTSLLRNVQREGEDLAQTQERLFRIAQATRVDMDATVLLYSRMAMGTKELNIAQSDLYRIVEIVNKTVAISGSTSIEATNAIRQFTQGISSNRLSGEELRSVLEQLPALAQALADGIGVPVGQLRELGAQGKLSTEQVATALLRMGSDIDAKFGNVEVTVGAAFKTLDNSLGRLIGTMSDSTNASSGLASIISGLSSVVDTLTDSLTDAQMALSELLSSSVAGDIRDYEKATEALREQQRVIAMLTEQYGENSDAVVNARNVLVEINQERGEAIRKLKEAGIDLSVLTDRTDENTDATDKNKEAQVNLASVLGAQIRNAVDAAADAMKNAAAETEAAAQEAEEFRKRWEALREELYPLQVATEEHVQKVKDLRRAYDEGDISLEEFIDGVARLKAGFIEANFEGENLATSIGDGIIGAMKAAADAAEEEVGRIQQEFEALNETVNGVFNGIGRALSFGGNSDGARMVASLQGAYNAYQDGRYFAAGQGVGEFYAMASGFGRTGNTASSLGGGIGGYLGNELGGEMGAIAGSIIGSIFGGLFNDEGETNPRIAITNNRLYEELDRGDPEGIAARYLSPFSRRSALGVTIQGQQITEALGGAQAQEVLNTIQQFDQLIANVAQSSGLGDMDAIKNALLGPSGESTRVYEEGFTTAQILTDRFNTVLQGFDATIRGLVGTVTDAEDGMRRLNAAVTLVTELNEGPIQQFEDALKRSSMTTLEVLDEQGQALRDQAADYSGTTAELERLAAGTQAFNQAVVATLLSIEQASRAVDQITTGTRDSIAFRQLGIDGGPNAQVGFLLQRARQLQGEIGGLGSAEAVQSQVQLINNLINQALGLVSDEDFARIVDKVTPILDATEGAAQERLGAIKTGVEDIADATTDAIKGISDTITPAAETISTAADTQSSAADRMLSGAELFAQNVVDFGGYVRNLPNTIQIVIPGVGEVNAAG